MLASRVARGPWGALRWATWACGARPGKGRALGALLPPAPICLGCLAERCWLRPAALGLGLPGAGPRGHCSGARKATPEPPAGEGAAAEAPGGPWSPANATSMYENPWTIPNMLSMTRIGLAPVLGYLIIEEDFNVALGVFALAGLTDLVNTAVQLILVAASLGAPVFNYAHGFYLPILCLLAPNCPPCHPDRSQLPSPAGHLVTMGGWRSCGSHLVMMSRKGVTPPRLLLYRICVLQLSPQLHQRTVIIVTVGRLSR
ncbi:cardiolipin synthase (CMP-forming) isoform X4 [Myotis daubentonii]|uniref:cardiolipin synthase (CMP-forming) isoform X4 n=1 Tax=Myotis daubentonii TaxID=98922 RepID=UPI002872F4D3|nr:cardiolipin synthase (CMP-forming) isoform X4 [Myotis daubentonii]